MECRSVPLRVYSPQWQTNLRIPENQAIKTVPGTPISHPFVERLIGTIRRNFLDTTLFWNAVDLANKLEAVRQYNNHFRVHPALAGHTPAQFSSESITRQAGALPRARPASDGGLNTNSRPKSFPQRLNYQFAMHRM